MQFIALNLVPRSLTGRLFETSCSALILFNQYHKTRHGGFHSRKLACHLPGQGARPMTADVFEKNPASRCSKNSQHPHAQNKLKNVYNNSLFSLPIQD
jgi:hypothetical protein